MTSIPRIDPATTFVLGNLTFGGTIVFETKDETCVLMLTGQVVRLLRMPLLSHMVGLPPLK